MKKNNYAENGQGYFVKLRSCINGDIIVKISDINWLMADGDNICVMTLSNMESPIKLKNSINEIEKLLNLSAYRVIACS